MTETPGIYNVGVPRPQSPPTFEAQLKALPPAVRSVAESLALRDMEGARRYVSSLLHQIEGGYERSRSEHLIEKILVTVYDKPNNVTTLKINENEFQ